MRLDVGSCVDGCIVEVAAGGTVLLGMVKGYEHPEGGVVIEPYRLGGRRLGRPTRGTGGVIPLSAEWTPCMPRPVYTVSASQVIRVVDPERALRQAWRSLPARVRLLIDAVDYEWAGLTGSWAVGLEGEYSDVDILLYGPEAYESIAEAHERLGWEPCGSPRRGRGVGGELGVLYRLKLVELCSGSLRVTLRLLRATEGKPCSKRRVPLGLYKGHVEIVDIGESYLVPARYRAETPSGRTMVLETWRTRYQELPPGLYRVEGEVWVEDGEMFLSPDVRGFITPAAWLHDS
ncbi:MAG: hypothetical protein LRS49_02630 [Desulfurococcales archaeon]|nr:hypothetical protein [Desulfurococcales archaeon]